MPQQPLKIAIAGALGRMGREMTEAVQVDPRLELVALS
ncbi:MAG: 4-hydroxy-tetrahydrodipicolinate reductase, partial [Mesorhizobium sp.]